jgi:hypothetical protein
VFADFQCGDQQTKLRQLGKEKQHRPVLVLAEYNFFFEKINMTSAWMHRCFLAQTKLGQRLSETLPLRLIQTKEFTWSVIIERG